MMFEKILHHRCKHICKPLQNRIGMVESKTGTMESKISMEKNTTARHKKILSCKSHKPTLKSKLAREYFFLQPEKN